MTCITRTLGYLLGVMQIYALLAEGAQCLSVRTMANDAV